MCVWGGVGGCVWVGGCECKGVLCKGLSGVHVVVGVRECTSVPR